MTKGETERRVMALVDHAKGKRLEQKKALCPVCKLTPEIRAQITEARARGVTQNEIIVGLAELYGIEISTSELQSHVSGRHDVK